MDYLQARQTLAKQGYHLVNHAAVKPCLWLNRSLRGGDQCYKHHFYGIASHRCVQMTPTLQCNHLCLHCWRPIDQPLEQPKEWLEPNALLEGVLREQNRILSGYGGSSVVDLQRLEEAQKPKHMAISLMGEPTFYPYLEEMIEALQRRSMTSFLVSNATNPEALAKVRPTQLYLSLNAPDRELYHRVSQPEEDLWDNVLESLSLLAGHPSRTVVRLTLARGLNMTDPQGYARLLEISEPDFVEVKAYMHLGRSRLRLERSSMPSHSEVMEFSHDLEEHLSYRLVDHVPLSRVALLSKGSKSRLISLE